MKVLIIDDKADEIAKAVTAATALGWEFVTCNTSVMEYGYTNNVDWIEMIQDVDGVVTDLMWNHADHGEKPMGLLVVIEALSKGKPVVICTNAGEFAKGHHGQAMGFINDGYYTSSDKRAFGIDEDKNWTFAMSKLAKRVSQ